MLISSPVIASFIRKNVLKEKQRMLKEGYNYEYDHMKRMIKCLQNFKNFDENDVKDKKWEKWLNELIERAKKERNTHDVWGSIKKNYKSIISSGVTTQIGRASCRERV